MWLRELGVAETVISKVNKIMIVARKQTSYQGHSHLSLRGSHQSRNQYEHFLPRLLLPPYLRLGVRSRSSSSSLALRLSDVIGLWICQQL